MSDSNGSDKPQARLSLGAFCTVIGAALLFAFVLWFSAYVGHRESTQREAERGCQNSTQCSQSSLEADIRAAVAAEATVDIGLMQVGVGGVSLIGLFWTVVFAYRAWKESEKAADAAQAALAHTERVANAELRPWVHIEPIPTLIDITDVSVSLELEMAFNNIGSTAARHVNFRWHLFLDDVSYRAEIEKMRNDWRRERSENSNVIMPGERVSFKARGGYKHVVAKWKMTDLGEFLWPYMTAAVFYRSDVDGEWKETFKTIVIEGPPAKYGIRGIPKIVGKFEPPDIEPRTHGATIAI